PLRPNRCFAACGGDPRGRAGRGEQPPRAPPWRRDAGRMTVAADRLGEILADQPQARIALEAALRDEDALSHAYLFHGLPGTGKRETARAFAAALISEGAPDPADAERRVLSGVHPDLE